MGRFSNKAFDTLKGISELNTNYLPTGLYLMQATLSNQEVIIKKY